MESTCLARLVQRRGIFRNAHRRRCRRRRRRWQRGRSARVGEHCCGSRHRRRFGRERRRAGSHPYNGWHWRNGRQSWGRHRSVLRHRAVELPARVEAGPRRLSARALRKLQLCVRPAQAVGSPERCSRVPAIPFPLDQLLAPAIRHRAFHKSVCDLPGGQRNNHDQHVGDHSLYIRHPPWRRMRAPRAPTSRTMLETMPDINTRLISQNPTARRTGVPWRRRRCSKSRS